MGFFDTFNPSGMNFLADTLPLYLLPFHFHIYLRSDRSTSHDHRPGGSSSYAHRHRHHPDSDEGYDSYFSPGWGPHGHQGGGGYKKKLDSLPKRLESHPRLQKALSPITQPISNIKDKNRFKKAHGKGRKLKGKPKELHEIYAKKEAEEATGRRTTKPSQAVSVAPGDYEETSEREIEEQRRTEERQDREDRPAEASADTTMATQGEGHDREEMPTEALSLPPMALQKILKASEPQLGSEEDANGKETGSLASKYQTPADQAAANEMGREG